MTGGLVVEAHVAADHRNTQGTASMAHASHAPFQLMVDLGPARVPEVEAVGERQGLGPGATEVSADFGDRYFASLVGVKVTIAAISVDAKCDGLASSLEPQDCRIASRTPDSIGLDLVVVLAKDRFPAGNVCRGQEFQQDVCRRRGRN